MSDKNKTTSLNVRLSQSDYDLIASAATAKHLSLSTFVRSLLITAIKQDLNVQPMTTSPSPELDTLSFELRQQLLMPIETIVKVLKKQLAGDELEKALLFAFAQAEQDVTGFIHQRLTQDDSVH